MADIRFDAEGGMHVPRPNGQTLHIPAEAAKQVIRLFTVVARMHDHHGWRVDGTLNGDDLVRNFLYENGPFPWNVIDHGNLKRTAIATENLSRNLVLLLTQMRSLAKAQRELNKGLKEMTAFWKDLRADYLRGKGPVVDPEG